MSDHYGSITISHGASNSSPPQPDTTPPKKTVSPKRRQQKWEKNGKGWLLFVTIAGLSIAAYFLAGVYLAPLAIQKYLPRYIQNNSNIEVSIEQAHLNPLNFELRLNGVTATLPTSTNSDPLLQIQSLFVDLDLMALVRNSFVCDRLTIQNMQLNLVRHKDNTYNFTHISTPAKAEQKGEIIDFSKLPFLFSLNNIDISDSRINLTDTITNKIHTIEKLHLAIPTLSNFSFQSNNYIQPHFSAIINGSPIQLSGEAVQRAGDQTFQTQLSCSIQSLNLVPFFSYLPDSFPMTLANGQADLSLQIAFSPSKNQGERLRIDLRMSAADITAKDKKSTMHIAIPAIQMDAILSPISKRLQITRLIAKKTHLTGTSKQIQNALQTLSVTLQNTLDADTTIQIDQLLADLGKLTLLAQDSDTQPSEWHNLQLSIRNFHSKNGSAVLYLDGEQLDNNGSFSWQGKLADTGSLQGKLLVREFPAANLLAQLMPVSEKTVQGNATFSGNISFSTTPNTPLSYTINNGSFEINKPLFLHTNKTWLKADSIRFSGLSRVDNTYSLGNIFLKETTLNINTTDLPPLLKYLFTNKNRSRIKGIDFSGNLHISPDSTDKNRITIEHVSFQANNLEKVSAEDNFAFSGQLADEATIKAKGNLNLAPFTIRANLAFSGINSDTLDPFFSQWPLLKNSTATFSGKGMFRYPSPSFQGNLRLTDTVVRGKEEASLLSWKLAELHNAHFTFAPFSLKIENLSLNSPQFQWQYENLSPFQHLKKGLSTLLENPLKKESPFPVVISKTVIKNGFVQSIDKRLTPQWETTFSDITGHVNNFSSRGDSVCSFSFGGEFEGTALTLSGTTTLLSSTPKNVLNLKIRDFPIVSFNKQLKSMPFTVDKATVSLDSTLTEKKGDFSSSTQMLITNLQADSISSDTALALALLKDSDNTFPMNIQIKNKARSLLNETVASFQTTTIKASYAPLLLDHNFKDLQGKFLIPFQAGTTSIDDIGMHTLTRYADLLIDHPGLGLTITGMADTLIDGGFLIKNREEIELQRVDTANAIGRMEYRTQQQATRVEHPTKGLQEEDITNDLAGFIPLVPEPVQIDDMVLLDLAQERSLIVYDLYNENPAIAPEQMTIANQGVLSPDSPSNGVMITIKAIATDLN